MREHSVFKTFITASAPSGHMMLLRHKMRRCFNFAFPLGSTLRNKKNVRSKQNKQKNTKENPDISLLTFYLNTSHPYLHIQYCVNTQSTRSNTYYFDGGWYVQSYQFVNSWWCEVKWIRDLHDELIIFELFCNASVSWYGKYTVNSAFPEI